MASSINSTYSLQHAQRFNGSVKVIVTAAVLTTALAVAAIALIVFCPSVTAVMAVGIGSLGVKFEVGILAGIAISFGGLGGFTVFRSMRQSSASRDNQESMNATIEEKQPLGIQPDGQAKDLNKIYHLIQSTTEEEWPRFATESVREYVMKCFEIGSIGIIEKDPACQRLIQDFQTFYENTISPQASNSVDTSEETQSEDSQKQEAQERETAFAMLKREDLYTLANKLFLIKNRAEQLTHKTV